MKTYFRSNTIYNQSLTQIDRANGIIKDIILCQVGEAKGHDLFINNDFIDKVVELGNETKAGIKARFGHPNICSTALGSYLGRYKNFRKQDDKAIADLYLDKTSIKSPNGNLYDYVLDLAESNPDMFGASIAFKAGKADKKLETINGVEVEKNYATIVGLFAADLVDDPAATNGLFEVLHEDDFAFQASVFLDEHPEIYELLSKKPEILNEFLRNYEQYKTRQKVEKPETSFNLKDELTNLKQWISDLFSKRGHAVPEEAGHTEVRSLEVRAEELRTEFESQLNSLESKYLDTINQLQTELNKSKAFPTVPDKKADPKINIQKKINTDDSGKVLLENIPDNVKRKLKNN
ncbi:MAG: hypothetical protein KQI35_17275 [Bacteroidetes bacterium]|nr:hypothetical protein [Bacteroidota bacterium]